MPLAPTTWPEYGPKVPGSRIPKLVVPARKSVKVAVGGGIGVPTIGE